MRTRKPFNLKPTNTEDGFTMPIALGFGLIMLLLATTSLIQSQNDNISAINKRSTARSLTAAETGVSRVQDFLNRNREAAAVSACLAPASTLGDCTDTATTATSGSWYVRGTIPNCPAAFSSADTDLTDNNNWQAVDSADTSKGEFRIVSYTGTGGVLTVEGRANVGTSGEARSRIEATMPVNYPTDGFVASLWVSDTITDSPTVNSNVVINDTACSKTAPSVTFPVSGDKVLKTTYTRPAPPSTPTTKISTTTTVSPPPALTNATSYYELTSIASVPGQQLPRSTTFPASPGTPHTANDQPGSDGVYRYVVPTIDTSFQIRAGEKVQIWVTGNIDLSNKVIVNQCGTLMTCVPFDVRIYSQTTAGTPTLKLNKATAVCDVFFHLPIYDVEFTNTGTVATQDCGSSTKNTGVYWVNKWTGAGTVIDRPRATWATALPVGITSTASPIRPMIGPINAWDRQSF